MEEWSVEWWVDIFGIDRHPVRIQLKRVRWRRGRSMHCSCVWSIIGGYDLAYHKTITLFLFKKVCFLVLDLVALTKSLVNFPCLMASSAWPLMIMRSEKLVATNPTNFLKYAPFSVLTKVVICSLLVRRGWTYATTFLYHCAYSLKVLLSFLPIHCSSNLSKVILVLNCYKLMKASIKSLHPFIFALPSWRNQCKVDPFKLCLKQWTINFSFLIWVATLQVYIVRCKIRKVFPSYFSHFRGLNLGGMTRSRKRKRSPISTIP